MVHSDKPKRTARSKLFALIVIVPAILIAVLACGPIEGEVLEGILQNVDAVNGQITITTKDGKTVTLNIATEATVQTEGVESTLATNLDTLEPGASVEVEVNEGGQAVRRIIAHLAKVEGTIVVIENNEVTVESSRGRRITALVTDRTRIELEDDFPGRLTDLVVGSKAEVTFDPESRIAFKIEAEDDEGRVAGVVVGVDSDRVTIETSQGRRVTLGVGAWTRFEFEDDFPGTVEGLRIGDEIEAKFDPMTRIAFEFEVEG